MPHVPRVSLFVLALLLGGIATPPALAQSFPGGEEAAPLLADFGAQIVLAGHQLIVGEGGVVTASGEGGRGAVGRHSGGGGGGSGGGLLLEATRVSVRGALTANGGGGGQGRRGDGEAESGAKGSFVSADPALGGAGESSGGVGGDGGARDVDAEHGAAGNSGSSAGPAGGGGGGGGVGRIRIGGCEPPELDGDASISPAASGAGEAALDC